MVMRPRSRPLASLLFGLALAALMALPQQAGAAGLDEEACNRLRTERQSLTVLGVDKNFDKGAEWAKSNLTVADLVLVKRYLDVFEQIKFRCEKVVALVEPIEKDEDDEESVADGGPPMPERNATRPQPAQPAKIAIPVTQAAESEAEKIVNSTDIAKSPGKRPTNANAVQLGPRKDLPVQ